MSAGSSAFFDTHAVLYLLSANPAKAERAEELLAGGGWISVLAAEGKFKRIAPLV
jgi:hypothetical protein